MAINLKNLFLFSLLINIFSCKKEININNNIENKKFESKITDSTNINGVALELINDNGKGSLKINSNNYKVKGNFHLKPPCYFLRYPPEYQNKVVFHSYPDLNIDKIIMFVGENGVQPIIFKQDSIIYTDYSFYSQYKDKHEYAPDEKFYYQFAHQRDWNEKNKFRKVSEKAIAEGE